MQVTPQQLKDWFAVFNQRYFKSKLTEPQFTVGHSRTRLGSLSWKIRRTGFLHTKNNYTIRLSNYYDVDERSFKSVLLHEMIHLYIESQHIKDTSSHGVMFRRIMAYINADGWNITVTSKTNGSCKAESVIKKRRRVVLAAVTTTGKHILSVINPDYIIRIDKILSHSSNVKFHAWYTSDDEYFADFPAVRTPRGRIVKPEIFTEKRAVLNPFSIKKTS